jgi:hypothetical protein
MNASEVVSRVEQMFKQRTEYEALWETAYKYIAPERAMFFSRQKRSPNEIQDQVFDSTAIDAAERLTNLIISGLTPPWQSWFRITPGPGVASLEEREAVRPTLQQIENLMMAMLSRSNFYQEMQPAILDRIVGGTCGMCLIPDKMQQTLRFKAIPLGELAVDEDDSGRVVTIARRYKLTYRQLVSAYGESRIPAEIRQKYAERQDESMMEVMALNDETPTGLWEYRVVLKEGKVELLKETKQFPYMFISRWSKIPGSVYGRGPGLRALADVRAINKIKELALKNAAKAVAGVYTVVDDGVVNPYTLTFEPGTFMPVGSNDRQNPTISELPQSGDFNVSMFTMDDLRNSILGVFMADNYGPLDRTPMTATEVQARTNIIAQDMGATIARMQYEMLLPIIRAVYGYMAEMEMVPPELQLDGGLLDVDFVSRLAQAQWAIDEQNLLEFTQTAVAFGEVDPKAGLIIDVHKALGRLAEIKHIPPNVLRTMDEIQQLIDEASQSQAAMEEQGGPPVGME